MFLGGCSIFTLPRGLSLDTAFPGGAVPLSPSSTVMLVALVGGVFVPRNPPVFGPIQTSSVVEIFWHNPFFRRDSDCRLLDSNLDATSTHLEEYARFFGASWLGVLVLQLFSATSENCFISRIGSGFLRCPNIVGSGFRLYSWWGCIALPSCAVLLEALVGGVFVPNVIRRASADPDFEFLSSCSDNPFFRRAQIAGFEELGCFLDSLGGVSDLAVVFYAVVFLVLWIPPEFLVGPLCFAELCGHARGFGGRTYRSERNPLTVGRSRVRERRDFLTSFFLRAPSMQIAGLNSDATLTHIEEYAVLSLGLARARHSQASCNVGNLICCSGLAVVFLRCRGFWFSGYRLDSWWGCIAFAEQCSHARGFGGRTFRSERNPPFRQIQTSRTCRDFLATRFRRASMQIDWIRTLMLPRLA